MPGSLLGAALTWAIVFFLSGDQHREPGKHENSLTALAGDFFFNDCFERESLEISTNGRFSLEYSCCTGGYRVFGNAKLDDGHLALTTAPLYRFFFRNAPTELLPIRWADRLYLVPKGAGAGFCNYINLTEGSQHPGGTFYIREGDEKKQVVGLPRVPKEWENMLLVSPLKGKIIEVMKHRRARVDFGSERGAWKGMFLWADCEGSPWVEAVAVHATSCVIESNHPATVFKVGDRVSSRQSRNH